VVVHLLVVGGSDLDFLVSVTSVENEKIEI